MSSCEDETWTRSPHPGLCLWALQSEDLELGPERSMAMSPGLYPKDPVAGEVTCEVSAWGLVPRQASGSACEGPQRWAQGCSDISVSWSPERWAGLDLKKPGVYRCPYPTLPPGPGSRHTHGGWHRPQQGPLVLDQALVIWIQLLDLQRTLLPQGPVLGHSLIQRLFRWQLPLFVGQEDWGLGRPCEQLLPADPGLC